MTTVYWTALLQIEQRPLRSEWSLFKSIDISLFGQELSSTHGKSSESLTLIQPQNTGHATRIVFASGNFPGNDLITPAPNR